MSDLSNINSGNDPCASAEVVCTLYANPNAISVTDAKDDPDEDNYDVFIKVRYSPTLKVTVRDFSGFNQDAWLLATRMLRPLRADNAVLTPGTRQAEVISRTLEAYLDIPVFDNILLDSRNRVLYEVDDPNGAESDILEVMDFARGKVTLPDPQTQPTKEERMDSPNLDVLDNLNCSPINPCTKESFTPEQISAIDNRIAELSNEFMEKEYQNTDQSAISLHNSELYDFAQELGIEVYAVIDQETIPAKITKISTGYRTRDTGPTGEESIGKTIWHNHPTYGTVWQNDISSMAERNRDKICMPGIDYTIYASGVRLTRASTRQAMNIEDPSQFVFKYYIYRNGNWEEQTEVGFRNGTPPSFSCDSNSM